MDFVSRARPIIDETSTLLNMTVFLALLDGNQIIYLYKKEPQNVPIHTASIGNRGDVYCTALGKAILSQLPENQISPLLDSLEFRRRTKRTIMNKEDLIIDLEAIRQRGYSLDNREVLDFVFCVGAPVFDHSGSAVAGISAAGLYSDHRDVNKEGEILMDAGLRLSRLLGFDKPGDHLAGG
jgi:DNA-binding IclR family transcriptional regulator